MKFAKPNRSDKVPDRIKLRETESGQFTNIEDKPKRKPIKRKRKTKPRRK